MIGKDWLTVRLAVSARGLDNPRMNTRWNSLPKLLLVTAGLLLTGCVERTITITSDPPGALVYLNDEEVGRTPVTVPFTFYGTYDVRLEHEDFQPLWTQKKADAPWWEAPGPDLVAEAIPNNKSELRWHFEMQLRSPANETELVDRARQMQAAMQPPATQPATK